MTGSIPLKLDWWEEQCGEGRDGEDVMELHIMHNAGMEREADGASDAGKLTDSQLDDTIDRLIENRKRLKLADGGQKLSIYLKKHIDEKNRRSRTPRPEFLAENIKNFNSHLSTSDYQRHTPFQSNWVARHQRQLKMTIILQVLEPMLLMMICTMSIESASS